MSREAERAKEPRRSAKRKLAEWVTLALSAGVILALAGFLAYEALQESGPLVAVRVECLTEEAVAVQGNYVLPVRVRNQGGRTVRDLTIAVMTTRQGRSEERREMKIDFLGESSAETVYFYLHENPRQGKVEGRALGYRLD